MKKTVLSVVMLSIAVAAAAIPASANPFETNTVASSNAQRFGFTPMVGLTAPAVGFARTSTIKSNGINFNGGSVMTASTGTNIYLIWYGTWPTADKDLVKAFITGLSGSAYFNINTTYYDSAKKPVTNKLTISGETSDAGSVGKTNLSDANIQSIVSSALSSKIFAADPKGIYLVLTGADVTKIGFLTNYCGWHTHATMSSTDIKYSFVGNPGTSPSCGYNYPSPNGNGSIDAMVSVIAHEIEEAVTDPDLNAWFDNRGYENADKCAWTFGTTTYTTSNGATANMNLGGKDFLVQRNWVNASGGYCALSY